MSLFWTSQEQIPAGHGFSCYHLPHLLWLCAIVLLCVGMARSYRRMNRPQRKKLLYGLVWGMLGLEIAKDIFLLATGQFHMTYLPLDLCGLSIFVEFAVVYCDSPLLLELVYSLSLPGACMALLFPDWNSLPLWNYMSLHSFLLHGLLILFPILLLSAGELRPNPKRLPFCFTCIAAACIPIALINRQFGTNFFFLSRPSSGSPLVWFERIFGNHVIGFPVLMAGVWLILYGVPVLVRCLRKRNKKHR